MKERIACPGGTLYTVKPGDTMYRISRAYGVDLDTLVAANPHITDPSRIQIGEVICIPGRPMPPCPGFVYTIKPGDTFYLLAQRYGTTVEMIERYNPGVNPLNLQIGSQICIPTKPIEAPTRRCLVMRPTDLAPNADGVAFLNYADNSITLAAYDLPDPKQFQNCVGYRLWARVRGTDVWDSVDVCPTPIKVWATRLVTRQPLTRYDALAVTAEAAEYATKPVGPAVLVADLDPAR